MTQCRISEKPKFHTSGPKVNEEVCLKEMSAI